MEVEEDWEFLAHQILTGSTACMLETARCIINHQTGNKEVVHHLQTYTSTVYCCLWNQEKGHVNVTFNQSILP